MTHSLLEPADGFLVKDIYHTKKRIVIIPNAIVINILENEI
jgi:hypothetical protein